MSGAGLLVKICGVTRAEDAEAAGRAGADAIGINFWPGSKRYVADEGLARELAAAARAAGVARVVGVCVNQPLVEVLRFAQAIPLDLLQLHGDEPEDYVVALGARALPVVRLATEADLPRVSAAAGELVLVDAQVQGYGGQGVRLPIGLGARAAALRPVILAGGLDEHTVAAVVRRCRPAGVDVASGVEAAPGIKDAARIGAFVAAARGA